MEDIQRFRFKKEERLTGKKNIERLFKKGIHIYKNCIHAVFLVVEDPQKFPVRVLFAVSRKKFKRAIKRNLIKRRLRESYRLNKYIIYDQLNLIEKKINLALIYEENEIIDYKTIEKTVREVFNEIILNLRE